MSEQMRFCSIEDRATYEDAVAGIRGSTAYISLVQTHGKDHSSRILQIADKTMVKKEVSDIQKWSGTALGGKAVCHRYRSTPGFFMEMNIYLKQQTGEQELTKDLVKKILYHDDLQFYDIGNNLLMFTVARNGTIAVREDLLS